MFCRNCGAKNDATDKFCKNCGTKLENIKNIRESKFEQVAKKKNYIVWKCLVTQAGLSFI